MIWNESMQQKWEAYNLPNVEFVNEVSEASAAPGFLHMSTASLT